MKDVRTIRAGTGLGDLEFGVTQEEVRAYLGEPDKISVDGEAGDQYVMWYYDIIDGFVAFDEEDDFRFCGIEVSSSNVIFERMALIGKSIAAVQQAISHLDMGDVEKEYSTYEDEGDERRCLMSFDAKAMNFWFLDDVLEDIQWGVFFNDDDEIIWPA